MREHDLEQMDIDELDALEEELRAGIEEADTDHDAVLGHDLRCVLDQVVEQKVIRCSD